MTVREYIGARYIPLFMGEWDSTLAYEPLSVVQYQGNSYTSRQAVPVGIDILNTTYWAVSGNYNAQVEAYRQEVRQYDGRITTNATDIDALETALATETADRIDGDDALQAQITDLRQIGGFEHATVEIFHDDTTVRSAEANTWTYLGQTIFHQWNYQTHDGGQAGWCRENASGMDALQFLNSIATEQEDTYRETVDIVILQFGYYDMYGTYPVTTNNFETRGRTIVNRARNLYPHAVVCVYPLTDKCYGTDRGFQLKFAQLQYGMMRSQVPLYMVPWGIALSFTKNQPGHYSDSESDNPYIYNSGGTNGVGSMIKNSLFGGEYIRETRSNIVSAGNGTFSTCEFYLDNDGIRCGFTSGRYVPSENIADGTVVAKAPNSMFVPYYAEPIAILTYRGTSSFQIIGTLVIDDADGLIRYRAIDGKNMENLIAGRTYRVGALGPWECWFRKLEIG